jgi:leader peptidase (prepilin peptidase)/N-methyltransferase
MLTLLLSFFIFLFGLIIGSFLNCVIYRLEVQESFVTGRSYCPHCKYNLIWLDLFPILSFLWLQGKCRYCKAKISAQYPLVEIITGLLFVLIFWQFGIFNILQLLFLWYMAAVLVVIFVYDLRHFLIPDKVLFPAIAIAFLYRLFESIISKTATLNLQAGISNYILAAFIASGFFLAIYLVSKGRWMGFGDVKLAILLGLILGFPNILAGLFLSFFFGAIIGVILILAAKKGLKSEVPFAPFLIVATGIALFWGSQIIQWYLNFLVF